MCQLNKALVSNGEPYPKWGESGRMPRVVARRPGAPSERKAKWGIRDKDNRSIW